jgi:hypothetical protein
MRSLATFLLILFVLPVLAQDTLKSVQATDILAGKVFLEIPSSFIRMSDADVKARYSVGKQPDGVFTDTSGPVDIVVKSTPNFAFPGNLQDYLDSFVEKFNETTPEAEWVGQGMKEINGKLVAYLELITPASDAQVYNLMVITDVERTLFLVTMNLPRSKMSEWQFKAHDILNSLVVR